MKLPHRSLTVLVAAWVFATGAEAGPEPLAPIPAINVPRYMGRWYEIAKYPNWFQKQCIGDTTADYSLNPDGTVKVINRCRTDAGTLAEAEGLARRTDPQAGQLKVRFAPAWLAWLPAVWGDYWIVKLDPDYRYVVVSEPKRDYLWIMARTPELDADTYRGLLQWLRTQGFDLNRLERSRNGVAAVAESR